MFLRFVKKKHKHGVEEYAQIAEKYRENGKQKTKVIMHLGPVKSQNDRDRYSRIFQDELRKSRIKGTELEKLSFDTPLDFGMMYASRAIMQETGIMRSLSILGKYRETVFLMITSRIMDPGSDLSLSRFLRTVYYPWDDPRTGKDEVYRALDALIGFKDRIEIEIFNALKPDVSMVHYDLTSTYFEGREENDLVLFGYSRDKKRGKEQIVIGIVMADGIPIYHEVWPGNTIDPKTLESTISVLKDRFHIKNVIFIGDRAFGRSGSLGMLDQNLFITAAYRWDQPYRDVLMNTDFTDAMKSGDLLMKEIPVETADLVGDNAGEDERNLVKKRRHIAVYNKDREKLDLADLDEKIGIVNLKISEITDQKELKRSLGKLKSLVKFTSDGPILNEKRIGILRKIAGRFLIVTNTDLPMDQVVSAYKEQWMIERSFRTMKSFIEIRPVYHRRSDRIKAHVFVCVLSLLISRIIEKRLSRSGMTIERVSETLSGMKVIPVTSPVRVTYRSESEDSIRLLKEIGINPPDQILSGALPKVR